MARNHDRKGDRLSRTRYLDALSRPELGYPTSQRAPAAGPTSMAVKVEDPETRRMIDEAVARRNQQ
jgi:hypothetical protein